MIKRLCILLLVLSLAGCRQSSDESQMYRLILGFKKGVAKEAAGQILDQIFEDTEAIYEPLGFGAMSGESIKAKFPERTKRIPEGVTVSIPHVYRVKVNVSEERLKKLISKAESRDEIEYVQKDFQMSTQ